MVPIFIFLLVVNSSLTSIGRELENYAPSDEETNFLASLSVFRGEGLYENFSLVYPPGRFIAQALFFRVTEPTVISSRVYMNFFTPLFFPVLLFFLTYHSLKLILRTSRPISAVLSYLGGWLVVLIDTLLVHSAQEVHVALGGYLLLLLWHTKLTSLKSFLLGISLGLIFLFRFESGLIILLSTFLSGAFLPLRGRVQPKLYAVGLLSIWLPVLILISINGSFINFLYDTVVLGLIVQPRTMGQPIPANDLKLVFLSSLILLLGTTKAVFSISRDEEDQNIFLRTLSLTALLSYVAALGRSDEGHLWYGLIWLPLMLILSPVISNPFRKQHLRETTLASVVLLFLGVLIIYVKSPFVFLIISSIFLLSSFPKFRASSYFLGGIIASLLVFRSVSYLSLRLALPTWRGKIARPFLQPPPKNQLAGLVFPEKTMQVLQEIKSLIPADSKLFIFPDRVIYYEFFPLPRVTRFVYLTGERTDRTEQSVISDLQNSPKLAIIYFPEKGRERGGEIDTWITQNTSSILNRSLDGELVELRLLRPRVE